MIMLKPIFPILLFLFIAVGTLSAELQGCSIQNIEIICERIKIAHLEAKIGDVLTCYADKSMKSTIPGSAVSSVVHKNGSEVTNLDNVEGLGIFKATVKFIPTNLGKKIPNLKFLEITLSGLLSVNKENFREFGDSLRGINLAGNKIISIDADLFEYNSNLYIIQLVQNPLRHIEPEFFHNLKNLKNISEVDLESAGCMNQQFDKRFGTSHNMEIFAWKSEDCIDETARVDEQNLIQEACTAGANSTLQIENFFLMSILFVFLYF